MQLPQNLVATGRSPRFTRATVPAALLSRHATAADVWARLEVHAGEVVFVDLAADRREVLRAGDRRVIAPLQPHRTEPGEDAEFELEFFRATASERPCS